MKQTARALFVSAVVLAFISTFSLVSHAQAPARVTQQIDDSQRAILHGNTRPEAMDLANDRGPLPDGYDLEHMLLVLQRSPEQQEALDTFIDSLNDRNSPNFHQWLDAEGFGQRFGVAQEDIDKIVGWLEYHGFRINQIYPSHMMIDISGSVGQVRDAFGTQMHSLEVNGKPHISNTNDPSIPAALSPVLKGVFSLHDFMPEPHFRPRPDYTFAGCTSSSTYPTEPGTCYSVTPQDNAVIYNLNPLWSAGYTGSGQTIAVIEDGDIYKTTDWSTYRTTFGLSSYPGTLTTVHPGSCTDPGDVTGVEGEVAIDVEVATGVAPGAAIQLSTCADTATTFGGLIALENIVNGASPYPGVVSISYGQCEVLTGSTGNLAFYNTYSQAATEGTSVFVSTGDDGPNSCGNIFSASYNVAGLGITGWGETPYNVAVGGTDFEDYYNAKTGQNGGAALSTYWNSTNGTGDVSAKKYVPEMPWNNSCGDVLIAEEAKSTFTTYGSTGFCNEVPGNTGYLSTGAASGGASNCATGAGSNTTVSALPTCQGWSKPSFQTGSSLTGGLAVYGQASDGVRDIPDVSMFAANGDWGHYETICWSDTAQSSAGGASCSGAPSTWSGFGGTSVATPSMAGIQALVNQYTSEKWGNPLTYYYQMGQNEYGTAGGTFAGSACNSSTGPASTCVFNDVTQGDIDTSCTYDGTTEEAHCYLPSGTYGVSSTDVITGAKVISGGTGYTSAPTCTIAGPSNNNPYKTPTGTTLWAGGTQATCTASFNSGSQQNVWTIQIPVNPNGAWASGGMAVIVGGTTYTFVTSLTAANQVLMYTASTAANNEARTAQNLEAAINATSTQCYASPCFGTGTTANASATATVSTNTVTVTAKTTGYAGAFQVAYGASDNIIAYYISINQTTPGSGPGYVSAITIGTAGSGYGPETPITLTGGAGTGAIAVANTTQGTAASAYQPAYGAAPGWDMATGLGTPNATNLVCSSVWGAGSGAPCTITTTTAVSSNHNPSTFGQGVTWTATITPSAATGSVQFVVDGTNYGSAVAVSSGTASSTPSDTSLSVGSHTVTANFTGTGSYANSTGTLSGGQVVSQASQTITCGTAPPLSEVYNGSFSVSCTASSGLNVALTWSGSACSTGSATTSASITMTSGTGSCVVDANQAGNSSYSAATQVQYTVNATQATQAITFTTNAPSSAEYGSSFPVAATGGASGNPVTIAGSGACSGSGSGSATITMTAGTGTCTVTANQAGNSNYSAAPAATETTNATDASPTVSVATSGSPSVYGGSVTFTATITSDTGAVKGRNGAARKKPMVVTGNVTWSGNTGCGTTGVTSGYPGTATCTTTSLPVGTDTITATYNGDSNHGTGSGSLSGGQVVSQASQAITFTTNAPSSAEYGSSFPVAATGGASGNPVTIAGSGACSGSGSGSATITMTAGTGTCTVTANQAGNSNYSAAPTATETTNATDASPTVSVATSGSPSVYGGSVTFTATITSDTGAVKGRNGAAGKKPMIVTGNVTWSGNTGCGTTSVTSGYPGTATCTTTSLPVGTDTITATYNGDSNHGTGSGSLSGGQVVSQASQTITFTTNAPSSAEYGSSFPVAATGGASGNPVTIAGSGACSGSGSGSATITMTAGTGTCTVTANQAGTTNYSAAPTATETTNATDANSSVSVGSSLSPSVYGQSVTFTATITSDTGAVKGRNGTARRNGARPMVVTGSVTWSDSNGPLTCTESASSTTTVTSGYPGTATCTTAALAVTSSDTITGAYSGDSNHGGGSGSVNQVVTASNGNVSVSSGLNPSAYGQSVTFTATITGDNGMAKRRNGAKPQNVSGTVTWSDSNGALICTESGTSTTTITSGYPGVATCTLSTLAVNPSDTITGNYSGDANHNAGSGTVMQTINAAGANVSVASSLNPSVYGESVTFTATINGANGLFRARRNGKKAQDVTGSVTWNDSNGPLTCTESSSSTTTVTPGNPGTATCTTAALAVASSDTITANYGGDSNHNTGTGTVSQEVDASGTTVSVASGLNPQVYGQPVTFTATINAASGALKGRKNGAKPMDVTGNVQWSADTGCGSTPVTPTGTGVGTATCTTSILPGGTDAITANYLGDANHGAGSGTLGGGEEIDPASQTTTFTTPAPASATYNTSFTVAATASSGLTVTFGVGAGSVCTNVGATFTMTSGTGSCTVVASQAGNGNYLAAPAAYGVAGAVPAIQTITVSVPAPAKADYASSFTIVATTNSGLPVQFGLGTSKQSNCTNVAGTYTMMSKNGYCYETINAAGNSNYSAAPEVDEHTQVTPPINPTVSFTGAPASAAYLSTFTVTASSTNDPNAPTIKTTGGCKVNSTADDGTTATAVIAITTGTGTCTMTANWAATATYAAHTATQKTTAEKATPVITWATPSPITYGTTLSGILDATANVAGTFVYKVNGTTVTATKVLAAGTYPLTATFTPTLTADYTTATDTVTLVVNQAATTTTITTTSPNPSAVNKAVKVSFTVTPGKPTGSVTVTASTGETCTGTVSSSGTGYCSITFTTSGARTLIASYSGDASNEASVSAGFTQTVN